MTATHIKPATTDNKREQALLFSRMFSGVNGEALRNHIYIMAGHEDPIDTMHPEVSLCPLKLAARSGKQALYSEIMKWVRIGQEMEKEDDRDSRGGSDTAKRPVRSGG